MPCKHQPPRLSTCQSCYKAIKIEAYQLTCRGRMMMQPEPFGTIQSEFEKLGVAGKMKISEFLTKAAVGAKLSKKEEGIPLSIVKTKEEGEGVVLLKTLVSGPTQRAVTKKGFKIVVISEGLQLFPEPLVVKVIYAEAVAQELLQKKASLSLAYEQVQLFKRESDTLTSFKHYQVMETIPGEDLASYIRHMGSSQESFSLAVDIAIKILQEVKRWHIAGWLHLDIKPENFMISTYQGRPCLKLFDPDDALLITKGSVTRLCGTFPYYRSGIGRAQTSFISQDDLSAAGRTIAELFISRAYVGPDYAELLSTVLSKVAISILSKESFVAVISHLQQKHYSSAEEAIQQLEGIQQSMDVTFPTLADTVVPAYPDPVVFPLSQPVIGMTRGVTGGGKRRRLSPEPGANAGEI